MSTRSLATRTELRNGVRVVFVSGEVDLAAAPRLGHALEQVLTAAPLIVELSGVEFLDSAGLRALAYADLTATKLGGRLVIVPSSAASRVFEITSLESAFELYPDLDAALRALGACPAPAETAD